MKLLVCVYFTIVSVAPPPSGFCWKRLEFDSQLLVFILVESPASFTPLAFFYSDLAITITYSILLAAALAPCLSLAH